MPSKIMRNSNFFFLDLISFSHIYIVIYAQQVFIIIHLKDVFGSVLNSIIKISICSIYLFKMYRKKCFYNKSNIIELDSSIRYTYIKIFIYFFELI